MGESQAPLLPFISHSLSIPCSTQPLGQFYLQAFLASLKEQGYAIFVVRNLSGVDGAFHLPLVVSFSLHPSSSIHTNPRSFIQVRGPFPQPQLPTTSSEGGGGEGGPGRWFSAEEAKAANDEAAEARQRGKV